MAAGALASPPSPAHMSAFWGNCAVDAVDAIALGVSSPPPHALKVAVVKVKTSSSARFMGQSPLAGYGSGTARFISRAAQRWFDIRLPGDFGCRMDQASTPFMRSTRSRRDPWPHVDPALAAATNTAPAVLPACGRSAISTVAGVHVASPSSSASTAAINNPDLRPHDALSVGNHRFGGCRRSF
ncbi:hypothetical protein DL771_011423 [Monosporascus sp. 5C6A]|nr:hypothetical protein DL771_011423 [Monosporascus sp. 5C6A]